MTIVHKKHEISKLPAHLEVHVTANSVIVNNITIGNITNNFNNLNIFSKQSLRKYFEETDYPRLKDMKKHKNWNPNYLDKMTIKIMHMCKSCGGKSIKGCCNKYASNNRSKIKIVTEWLA